MSVTLKQGRSTPSPFLIGIPGAELDDFAREVIEKLNPAGFILFKRNCESPEQTGRLCTELAKLSPFVNPLIFIDQEGGRVARIRWDVEYTAPPAAFFGKLYENNEVVAVQAARANGYLLASQLSMLGITGNCAPVADVVQEYTHDLIGDRSFSSDPKVCGILCGATLSGLLAGGVWGVIKHAPGHGRAEADSHCELPIVSASEKELQDVDFLPFKTNNQSPFVMTAHVKYEALDASAPATQSKTVLQTVLREQIGMSGLIMADDLNMQALSGSLAEKAEKSLTAGCDLLLHCGGNIQGHFDPTHFADLEEIAGQFTLSDSAMEKLANLPTLGKLTAEGRAEALRVMEEVL